MKINIISILAPLASAAIFAGCAKTAAPEYSWSTDPDAVRIEASVGALTKTNPFDNAEKQKQFNGPDANGKFLGDEIAVSMVDNSGQVEKTVTYRFDAEVWNPVPATDYLVWKSPVTYKAWYPASSKDGFTLPTDQSESLTENYGNSAKADFMTGEYACDSKIPTDHKLKLVMQRKMALVTVNVDKTRLKNQFEGKNIYKINVESIQSGYSTVSSDGTGSGNPVDVKPGPTNIAYDNNAGKGVYHAIVVPCDGDASAKFLKITVCWKPGYDEDKAELYVTGRPAFEAGKHYTYNLTIGKDKVEAGDITVSNWGSIVPLIDGGSEQDADKLSDPISMTDLRTQLKAWNDANPNAQKSLADMITTELLDESLGGNGELVISGEFDNSGADSDPDSWCGMSGTTLDAFARIAEYVRSGKVKKLDISGLKGIKGLSSASITSLGTCKKDCSFYGSKLETFIGSSEIVALYRTFRSCDQLTSVSGLENVTTVEGEAFAWCRKLESLPDMPLVTSFKDVFTGSGITELRHKNVKELSFTFNCPELRVIDCPSANNLSGEWKMPKLTELHLESEYFERFDSGVFNNLDKSKISLYLNANQKGNVVDEASGRYWHPKKNSAGDTPDGYNSPIKLNDFAIVYFGGK